MKSLKKTVKYGSIAAICAFALTSAPLHAQFDDSTAGSRALSGRGIVPLKNQERETPVTNNITNTTQQVTQQITQVVQPNVSTASGSAYGNRFATAWANCGSGTLLGGGGSCSADNGYAAMPTSQPNGNSWQVICDAFQGGNVAANAWATCSN